jgi:xanthine dehydrogenase accessory factor
MDIFEQIAALRRRGEPFAVATVVARRAPVSAHLGDRAIVFADGRMEGFVGGACSREIIRAQALDTLRSNCARLVSIRPGPSEPVAPTTEHVVVPMTCVSEGGVDVYVEPFVPPRRLLVVGATPIAEALARLARGMEYDVVRVVDTHEQRDIEQQAATLGVRVITLGALESELREGDGSRRAQTAVVASQGHYDEQALESILTCNVKYVGLVASRKRGAMIRTLLESSGVPGIAAMRNPAGLDLGATTPSEVALSILAEIVQAHPSGAHKEGVATTGAAGPATARATAVDPVCGMEVAIVTARHTVNVDGSVYYFCCASCRAQFVADPSQYRTQTS